MSGADDAISIFADLVKRATDGLHERLAGSHPKLSRGRVWCRICGHTEAVDAVRCLRSGGWPTHCGQTMTIDAPTERP
jgi:hypothetical protein